MRTLHDFLLSIDFASQVKGYNITLMEEMRMIRFEWKTFIKHTEPYGPTLWSEWTIKRDPRPPMDIDSKFGPHLNELDLWIDCALIWMVKALWAINQAWARGKGVECGQLPPLSYLFMFNNKRKYMSEFRHFYFMPFRLSSTFSLFENLNNNKGITVLISALLVFSIPKR